MVEARGVELSRLAENTLLTYFSMPLQTLKSQNWEKWCTRGVRGKHFAFSSPSACSCAKTCCMINEPVITASCARCDKCPAWVVLHHPKTSHVSRGTYEFSCPVEGCGAVARVGNHQLKLFQIPESWLARGYFYENELKEISDAITRR